MNDIDRFESRFEAWIQARADLAVRPCDVAAIARTAVTVAGRHRRGWGGLPVWHPTVRLARILLVALLVALLGGAGVLVGSQLLTPSPVPLIPAERGVFTPTGSPAAARWEHTATLLTDGRVLVVGGGMSPTSAEVWDPETGRFAPTGSLATGRRQHTAARLVDGRVLIAGGIEESADSSRTVDTAEMWNPETGAFSLVDGTTSLPLAAEPTLPTLTGVPAESDRNGEETTTLLRDGRILIVGGRNPCDIPAGEWQCAGIMIVDLAEIWDPATGTFSPAGRLARFWHTATLLLDGRVLIVGGHPVYDYESVGDSAVWQSQ